jgi:hypothetical protein
MASSRGVYGVEALAGREEVTIMGPVGKETGEGWVCSEPIVGVSRVEALAGREEVTITGPDSGGLLLRERSMALLERIMLVALSVALAWALALALLMRFVWC